MRPLKKLKKQKRPLMIAAAILSAAVALVGALGMGDRVRTVDIVTLFFGGLAAGASVVSAVSAARRPNIFPALKYQDGPAALAWLKNTFGFTGLMEMAGPDGGIAHAELKLGPGVVMLGSVGKPDPKNPWSTAPQGLYVYVPRIEEHYERARAAGAAIVRELHNTSYGAREYSATDLEGRLWSFGTYYPET